MTLHYGAVAGWITECGKAWVAGDATPLVAGCNPDVEILWQAWRVSGRDALSQALAGLLATGPRRLLIRRALIDAERAVAAVEWLARLPADSGTGVRELLGGVAMDFDDAGLVSRAVFALDMLRSRQLDAVDAPWPDELWQPSVDPGPPPQRADMEAAMRANTRAWHSRRADSFDALVHPEVHLCPPWDYRIGRPGFRQVAQYHFDHYQETQVTVRRVIFDATQPHFGVCQQTFACTDQATGRRGEDEDFAFFELCHDKLRYWRNYFDAEASVQSGYDTVE